MGLRSLFHQNTTYNAADLRALIDALGPTTVGENGAVVKGLDVSYGSSHLTVSAGVGIATANASTTGHNFAVVNTTNVDAANYSGGSTTWAPQTGSTPRTDIVFLVVADKALDVVANDVTTVHFSLGTTTLPDKTCVKLAEVTSANSVLTSITDSRTATRRWEDPWGVVGRGVRVTSWGPLTSTGTTADVVALNATLTANRLYRVSLHCRIYTAGGGRVGMTLTNSDASTTYTRFVDTEFYDGAGNTYTLIGQSLVHSTDDLGGAGARSFMLRAGNADTNTLYIDAKNTAGGAGIPGTSVTIEDIGPDTTVPFT